MKTKKAVLYARVACIEESKETDPHLTYQVNELNIYCKANKVKVARIYYEAASGNSFNRNGFQKLLDDITSKKIKADLLLFTQLDRFSRNATEAKKMTDELKQLGVEAKSIKDGTSSNIIYDSIKKNKK